MGLEFWVTARPFMNAAGEKLRDCSTLASGKGIPRQARRERREIPFFLDFVLLGDLGVVGGKSSCRSLLGTNPTLFLNSPFIRFAKAVYSTQFPHRTLRRSIHGGRAGAGN